jgi:hypothetical protein
VCQTPQEHAGLPLDRIGDDLAVGEFRLQRTPDDALVDIEQGHGELDQFFDRQAAMALVRHLLKRVGDPRRPATAEFFNTIRQLQTFEPGDCCAPLMERRSSDHSDFSLNKLGAVSAAGGLSGRADL